MCVCVLVGFVLCFPIAALSAVLCCAVIGWCGVRVTQMTSSTRFWGTSSPGHAWYPHGTPVCVCALILHRSAKGSVCVCVCVSVCVCLHYLHTVAAMAERNEV